MRYLQNCLANSANKRLRIMSPSLSQIPWQPTGKRSHLPMLTLISVQLTHYPSKALLVQDQNPKRPQIGYVLPLRPPPNTTQTSYLVTQHQAQLPVILTKSARLIFCSQMVSSCHKQFNPIQINLKCPVMSVPKIPCPQLVEAAAIVAGDQVIMSWVPAKLPTNQIIT